MENSEYERKKEDDLQRLSEAHSHAFHQELVEKSRIQIQPLHDLSRKQPEMVGSMGNTDLDIPESVGLSGPQPSSAKRLVEPGSVRCSTRRRQS
uniref:Uncharacterized protein n=1 Tax=Arundo donax TaxID=35708 RepID=A0A0A9EV09_ARUDO